MALLENLLSKKLLFVSGKGGVGKSVTAAVLAKEAAKQGKRVLLMESSGTEHLSPLFGVGPVGHKEVSVGGGIHLINLNPESCFEEYVSKHLGFSALYEKIFEQKIVKSFLNAVPGLGDIMMLGRMLYSLEIAPVKKFDLLVFDAPAFGHFLALIKTPLGILKSPLTGPLVKEVSRISDLLKNPDKSAFVAVLNPKNLVVCETLDFLPRLLDDSPVPLGGIVLNRSYPNRDLEEGLVQLNSCDGLDQEKKLFLQDQWRQILQEKRSLFQGIKNLGIKETMILEFRDFGTLPNPLGSEFLERVWL